MFRENGRGKSAARVLALMLAIAMVLMTAAYLFSAISGDFSGITVFAAETREQSEARLALLPDVLRYILENYADELSLESLTDAAYEGVFDSLDPWSVYYRTDEEKDSFVQLVSGKYEGVGVVMAMTDGRCVINSVNPLGPAYEAGVPEGGVITAVDGKSVSGMELAEISALIKGESGTEVVLRVEKDGRHAEYRMTRRPIQIQTVYWKMLDENTGYIDIDSFSGNTFSEFYRAKLQLLAEGMESLVIDLRDNGGGVMGDAVNIADKLFEKGVIMSYEQQGEIVETYYASGSCGKLVPLAVLINGGTASASECLAAAVKDNGAGVLVGTQTYGKGVAQAIIDIGNGDSMKLSSLHFLTPLKKRIDGVGVSPDIAVYNGAAISDEEKLALRSRVLAMDEGKKYFRGQVGINVLAAQQRLAALGYDVEENARMDEKTVEALRTVQAQYGAFPYGGLDFCTLELVEKAFSQMLGGAEDAQLARALEIVRAEARDMR